MRTPKREGLDPAVALQRVKLERERNDFDQRRAQEEAAQRQQRETLRKQQEDFLRFKEAYPDVNPKDIPQEVWDKVREGASLLDTYTRHENKKLREEIETLKKKAETAQQNTKNKERSTGSQKTAGTSTKEEAFDNLWYDGT